MPPGRIKSFDSGRNIGIITPDDGSQEVKFFGDNLQHGSEKDIRIGARVQYELRAKGKQPTTRFFSIVKGGETPFEETAQSQNTIATTSSDHRFLNPYNFVRWLTPRDAQDAEPPEVQLMGHCPPPPHDRWVGLSGIIHCKAVAEAPVFVADAENVTQDKGEPKHKHYHFFKYGDKEAIPATSLRGPVRNIFEAATNSCFSNLEDKRLSYHFNANDAPKLIPARLVPGANGWELELLTGTTPLQEMGQIPNPQYAAWVQQYEPLEPSKTLLKDPPPNAKVKRLQERSRTNQRKVNLKNFKHGDDCYALLQDFQHPHPHIRFWDVLEISDNESVLRKKIRDPRTQRVEHGWLCLTNQNIGTKHSERFFFRANDNNTGPRELPITDDQVLKDYLALIQDYQERHEREVEERRETRGSDHDHEPFETKKGIQPGFSRFVYQKEEARLSGNELVYVDLQPNPHGLPIVKHLVPVSVPRVMYENSLADRLPHQKLKRCQDQEELCPACRTFGWIHGEKEKEGAFASRVRFSHATVCKAIKTQTMSEILLAILSSPKPTTTRFYLIHKSWRANARNAWQAGYDNRDNVLRGRKFYRHFGSKLNSREYTRATDAQHNGKDRQNRTLHGVLDNGSEFKFTVHFENLAPVELGALLWSLEIDGRGFHRLGLAKPLGFGSVRIEIDNENGKGLQGFVPQTRYGTQALHESGWQTITADERKLYVAVFKRAMVKRYSLAQASKIQEYDDNTWAAAFETLPNIADLRALLEKEPPPQLEIHYPRVDPDPKPDGENFKWFMANNYETAKERGEWLELDVPAEESKNAKGLPLQPGRLKVAKTS